MSKGFYFTIAGIAAIVSVAILSGPIFAPILQRYRLKQYLATVHPIVPKSTDPLVNVQRFRLKPISPHMPQCSKPVEAEVEFWEVKYDMQLRNGEPIQRFTTTTLRTDRFESIPLPAAGDFMITFTSGTACLDNHTSLYTLSPGQRAWLVTKKPRSSQDDFSDDIDIQTLIPVSGRVVDDKGKPIADATVHGSGVRKPKESQQSNSIKKTGNDGVFKLYAAVHAWHNQNGDDQYSDVALNVEKNGYVLPFSVGSALQNRIDESSCGVVLFRDIIMKPGRIINGRVLNDDGTPASRVTVTLKGITHAGAFTGTTHVTDINGHFTGTIDSLSPAATAIVQLSDNSGFSTLQDLSKKMEPIRLKTRRRIEHEQLRIQALTDISVNEAGLKIVLQEYSPIAYEMHLRALAARQMEWWTKGDLDNFIFSGEDLKNNQTMKSSVSFLQSSFIVIKAIARKEKLESEEFVIPPDTPWTSPIVLKLKPVSNM